MSSDLEKELNDEQQQLENLDEIISNLLPDKCSVCSIKPICSVITTYAELYNIGIKVQIENCNYFRNVK